MLQVFHLDVAKVDLDAVYICMVASVCLRFKHMFLLFHLDVVYILQWLHMCFSGVSDVCLQVFQLFQTYVASVSSGCCKSRSDVAHVAM